MQKDLNGMEQGNGSGSRDLEKPLLAKKEKEGSEEPRTSHHRRHTLRSRRDAVLPNSGYAIFSTLMVALGPLALGFAVSLLTHDFSTVPNQFLRGSGLCQRSCLVGVV